MRIRETQGVFAQIIRENRKRFSTGIVHGFGGDLKELQEIIDLDLYLCINGGTI
jgi:TatD DNase family protein